MGKQATIDIFVPPDTPAKKSYGVRNGKRVYEGYNAERKVIGRKQKELKRGKYFYAKGQHPDRTENALPKGLLNEIICADSLSTLKKLPDRCVDLVFTSPPYNFGLDYDQSADDMDWQGYFNNLFAIFDECCRVLKHGGRMVVNVQPLFSDYIPSHHLISKHLMDIGLIWKGEILWEKNNYNCKYTAWGSWKSPAAPYLKYTWEFLEIFCKGDIKKSGKKEAIDISVEEFKKWVVAKWSLSPERKMKQFGHPAMFPVPLCERVLKLFSFQGDTILDPFNGAGTTTWVARQTGRNYLGIDISKEYCDTAKTRLCQCLPRGKSKLTNMAT